MLDPLYHQVLTLQGQLVQRWGGSSALDYVCVLIHSRHTHRQTYTQTCLCLPSASSHTRAGLTKWRRMPAGQQRSILLISGGYRVINGKYCTCIACLHPVSGGWTHYVAFIEHCVCCCLWHSGGPSDSDSPLTCSLWSLAWKKMC